MEVPSGHLLCMKDLPLQKILVFYTAFVKFLSLIVHTKREDFLISFLKTGLLEVAAFPNFTLSGRAIEDIDLVFICTKRMDDQ